MVRESNPGGVKIFRTQCRPFLGPSHHPAQYRSSFSGVKRPGLVLTTHQHVPPRLKKEYSYNSLSGPSYLLIGRTLFLSLIGWQYVTDLGPYLCFITDFNFIGNVFVFLHVYLFTLILFHEIFSVLHSLPSIKEDEMQLRGHSFIHSFISIQP